VRPHAGTAIVDRAHAAASAEWPEVRLPGGSVASQRCSEVCIGLVRVRDVAQLAPDEHDEQGRSGEGKPERCRDAERSGQQATDTKKIAIARPVST
jgi:hypothetical protein